MEIPNVKTSLILAAIIALFFSCDDDDGQLPAIELTTFKVTLENVMTPKDFSATGKVEGLAMPGQSQEFTFHAGPGNKLSFATMLAQSNDLIFAPAVIGIELYNADNSRISGDITGQIFIWDIGTEVNEEPGAGPNQGPRQSDVNTGPDENGTVELITNVNDGFSYPLVNQMLKVTLETLPGTDTGFKLLIENVSGGSALPTPLDGLVWTIHTQEGPFFTEGEPDRGNGLEAIAEDGKSTLFSEFLVENTGVIGPISPGIWAVHDKGINPLFITGQSDFGEGLEAIAEDGDPSSLALVLSTRNGVNSSAVFNTPSGASQQGNALPGNKYEFTIKATESDYLSFATMLVQSNDLFYAPKSSGIPLFTNGVPISGEVTDQISLFDAGTEVNEAPGLGSHQAPRQANKNSGNDENGTVEPIENINDGFNYAAAEKVIRVTITPQ